jgi:hypothetical protein
MAALTGRFRSRTFHFEYAPRAAWYSGPVALLLALIAILGSFSIALIVLALVLVSAAISIVMHWFHARRPPARGNGVPRLKGPEDPRT